MAVDVCCACVWGGMEWDGLHMFGSHVGGVYLGKFMEMDGRMWCWLGGGLLVGSWEVVYGCEEERLLYIIHVYVHIYIQAYIHA